MNSWKQRHIRALFLLLSLALLFALPSYAHPGSLDSKGGHYDRSTGKYHYHHGYPAHQHTGGICPYDFDDQTDRSSGELTSASSSTSYSDKNSPPHRGTSDSLPSLTDWLSTLFVAIVFLWWVLSSLIQRFKKRHTSSKSPSPHSEDDSIFSKFSSVILLFWLVLVCSVVLLVTSNSEKSTVSSTTPSPSNTLASIQTQNSEAKNPPPIPYGDIYTQSLELVSHYAEESDMPIKSYCRYCMTQQYMSYGNSEADAIKMAEAQIPDVFSDSAAAYVVVAEMAQQSALSISEYILFCENQLVP